jgi:hypothetical protein
MSFTSALAGDKIMSFKDKQQAKKHQKSNARRKRIYDEGEIRHAKSEEANQELSRAYIDVQASLTLVTSEKLAQDSEIKALKELISSHAEQKSGDNALIKFKDDALVRMAAQHAEIKHLIKANRFLKYHPSDLYTDVFWDIRQGQVTSFRVPKRNMLAMNVGPFHAFKMMLKFAEIRAVSDDFDIDSRFGQPGRFSLGRGYECMDFMYPTKASGDYKYFRNLGALEQNYFWWSKCYDHTDSTFGSRNTKFGSKELKALFKENKWLKIHLIVFIPKFVCGPQKSWLTDTELEESDEAPSS